MEWLSFVTLICLQIAPGAKVPIEKCEAHYRACVEDLAKQPKAKSKGYTHEVIASSLYEVPQSRIELCK